MTVGNVIGALAFATGIAALVQWRRLGSHARRRAHGRPERGGLPALRTANLPAKLDMDWLASQAEERLMIFYAAPREYQRWLLQLRGHYVTRAELKLLDQFERDLKRRLDRPTQR